MNNRELNLQMKVEVARERRATIRILKLIVLAEKQKTHLELGFASLHAWLIHEHKYSERAANRRVQAARLLRDVPEASAKLDSGSVNLTNLAKAQSMIRKQGDVSAAQKREALALIENQTEIRAEQRLCELLPANKSSVTREHSLVIDQNTQRLSVNLPNEAIADLQRIRELLSHKIPSCEASEVLPEVFADYRKRHDPLLQAPSLPLARRASRKIIIQEAEGCCQYHDPSTGKVCGSRIRVERDHIRPRANGGDDSVENARLLCDSHNRFMSEKILGRERANQWRARKHDQR